MDFSRLLCTNLSGARPSFAKEIFIKSGNLFTSGQTKPIEDLLQAIRTHKNSLLFRVTWNVNASSASSGSTILYDRQRHTLKYYNAKDWIISDNEPVTGAASSLSVVYTGVKDSMIPRLLKEFNGMGQMEQSSTDADTLLPKLVKFGAKKRQLSKTYRKYVVKQNR